MLNKWIRLRKKNEAAFTLLEYCAGAAVLLTIVWLALNTMGGNIGTLLNKIGSWATNQAAQIDDTSTSGGTNP